jgi:hypothetical protein
MAHELGCLTDLIQHLQFRHYFAWLVSHTSEAEFQRSPADRRRRLEKAWQHVADDNECWEADAYPALNRRALSRSHDDELPNQLRLALPRESLMDVPTGWLQAIPDAGDRQLLREARSAGVPAVLTTDLRSLWRNRGSLYAFGIEVWRPSDALWCYHYEPGFLAAAA